MSTGASKPPDGVGNEQKPEDSNQVVDKLKQELDSTKYELAVALAVLEASSNKCTELERELESSKQTAAKNLKDAEDDHSGEIKKIKQALDWGLADGCLIRRLPSPSNHIIAKLKAANAALQTKINEGQAEVNKARKSNEEVDQIRKDANKAISRLSHENAHLNRQLNEDTRRKNALAEIEKLKAVLDAKTATPEKTTDAKDTKEANTESAPRSDSSFERHAVKVLGSTRAGLNELRESVDKSNAIHAGNPWGIIEAMGNLINGEITLMLKRIEKCLAGAERSTQSTSP